MKVLIADKFEKVGVDGLQELGCTVVSQPDVKAEDLPAAIKAADPHILIVRGKKVTGDALRAGTALTLVIRAGAGIDTIDVNTASSLGVFVSNCPGKNSIAVAELVLGLLLSCDRRIPDQVAELRAGTWNKGEYSKARGLHGRTLGIVGLGQIGRETAARAQAFGMRVVAWSRHLTHEEADRLGLIYAQTPLEVARVSDAISINVAANAETKHLVNAE
ncbi:MAG TPA: NAD(P)-dependent oxidoreductase, partial [Gemmatimonadales bacterium]|nr:NAD(P)-dependent oxidoreductase [Gemmatimonadales bacterium]